jgi:hypothetical protein
MLRKCEESQDNVTNRGESSDTSTYRSNGRPSRCVSLRSDIWFTVTVTVDYSIIKTEIDFPVGGGGGSGILEEG